MRAYADSSFILRLVAMEAQSVEAIGKYRSLGHPPLYFLALHLLEVRSAIFQRAFHQRRSISSTGRAHIARERDAALARLDQFIARRALLDVAIDTEFALGRAVQLSTVHTERIGARSIDLLHVACALTLEVELFLTTDQRQALLAKAEGMDVIMP